MKLFASLKRAWHAMFTPQICLIWAVSLWLMLTSNHALFAHILNLYPWNAENAGFIVSLSLFFTFSITWWLMLLSHGKSARWVLAAIILSAAWAAFYMDEFGVIIDHVMLDNAIKTDAHEVMGLLSWGFFIKMVVLGIIPALVLIKAVPAHFFVRDALSARLKQIGLLMLGMVLVVIPFSADYATFVREHKMVRMYANPTFFHYSLVKWASKKVFTRSITGLQKTAVDAINVGEVGHHELIIMVVGETARFDRFSLNGYHRLTNPRLSKESVLSLKQVTS
ncbi:MAG TPA: phosphoethanolamine transferase domain-containing protein, partial [Cellvibrio sp.]